MYISLQFSVVTSIYIIILPFYLTLGNCLYVNVVRRGSFLLYPWWAPGELTHWGRDKMDDTFKRISVNENVRILIEISLKFVPKGPINNIPALVQIMAWHRPGDKPLSEPMLVCLPTHICATRPQWVKSLEFGIIWCEYSTGMLDRHPMDAITGLLSLWTVVVGGFESQSCLPYWLTSSWLLATC